MSSSGLISLRVDFDWALQAVHELKILPKAEDLVLLIPNFCRISSGSLDSGEITSALRGSKAMGSCLTGVGISTGVKDGI